MRCRINCQLARPWKIEILCLVLGFCKSFMSPHELCSLWKLLFLFWSILTSKTEIIDLWKFPSVGIWSFLTEEVSISQWVFYIFSVWFFVYSVCGFLKRDWFVEFAFDQNLEFLNQWNQYPSTGFLYICCVVFIRGISVATQKMLSMQAILLFWSIVTAKAENSVFANCLLSEFHGSYRRN